MCCLSQRSIKNCSSCLCATSFLLFAIMGMMGILGLMISKRDILKQFSISSSSNSLTDRFSEIDLYKGSNLMISFTIICICFVFLGLLFTWFAKLDMGSGKCCTLLSVCTYFILIHFFLIVGTLLTIPSSLKESYIEKNCDLVNNNKID